MAWFNIRKSAQSPEAQVDLDSLRAMKWPEFESLMAEAYRQRGYAVEKTGKGGLEGDIDLILGKDGRTELVQCKQWQARQVGTSIVREMWSVVGHRKADAVKIVIAGTFTAEARRFAEGKAIELIDGERLLELVRDVATASSSPSAAVTARIPQATAEPVCPQCGATMFKRFSRQTNQMFWSCLKYPGCKGMRPL